jgi:hypothetical protein
MFADVKELREEPLQAGPNPFDVRIFGTESTAGSMPEATVWVDEGYKVIGGGAAVRTPNGGDWRPENGGNFLFASHPLEKNKSPKGWFAKSKDHFQSNPAKISAYAIAIYDPHNLWDVIMVHESTGPNLMNTATVYLPEGCLLTGGGARVEFPDAVGQLLTASYPEEFKAYKPEEYKLGWTAKSRWHLNQANGTLHVYAIGIKPNGKRPLPQSEFFRMMSKDGPTNWAQPQVSPEYRLVGGGVWSSDQDGGQAGQLLLGSYPHIEDGVSYWIAESKWHHNAAKATLIGYAIGIKPSDCR